MMRLKTNNELSSLLNSSFYLVFIRVGGLACGFLLMLLLARTISAEEVGRVITAISVVMLLSVFATLNYDAGALRYLSDYLANGKSALAATYIKYGNRITGITGTIISLSAMTVWAIGKYLSLPLMPDYMLFAFLSVFIFGRMRLFSGYMHASGKVVLAQLPRSFIRQLLLLAVIAVLVALGVTFDADIVMLSFMLTLFVVAALQSYMYKPYLKKLTHSSIDDNSQKKNWLQIGFHTLTPVLFLEFSVDVIILISAFVLSKPDVAVLAVVLRIAGFLQFGVTAINMAVGPKIASALHNGEDHAVNHLLRVSGVMKILIVLVGLVCFYFFGHLILSVFGEEYSKGTGALMLFACMSLIISVFGPGVLFVTVLDTQKYLNPVFMSSLAILCVLILFLGSKFGIQGVACATLFVWTAWNLTLYILTKLKHGYDISLINLLAIAR